MCLCLQDSSLSKPKCARQCTSQDLPIRALTDSEVKPHVYMAVYSSVPVYEMMVRGIGVMRRRSDSYMNATQLLKVAGVDKGRRTKVLERDVIQTGVHEKVQGGYGRYQGTWLVLLSWVPVMLMLVTGYRFIELQLWLISMESPISFDRCSTIARRLLQCLEILLQL